MSLPQRHPDRRPYDGFGEAHGVGAAAFLVERTDEHLWRHVRLAQNIFVCPNCAVGRK